MVILYFFLKYMDFILGGVALIRIKAWLGPHYDELIMGSDNGDPRLSSRGIAKSKWRLRRKING